MNAAPSFAVVVPFFNEGGNVEAVCEELKLVLAADYPDAEVIFVDDGSTDETAQVLDDFARGWPAVRVHHLRTNRGQSGALLFGFKQTNAPVLVTMDGDGQNDPRDIPKLLARLVDTDMVVGVRMERKDSWARRNISRVANHYRSLWLGDGAPAPGRALKVFRREVRWPLLPLRPLGRHPLKQHGADHAAPADQSCAFHRLRPHRTCSDLRARVFSGPGRDDRAP